jgi:hypothetical protein
VTLQLVVPTSLQKSVLKHFHDIPSAGHLCAEKVVEKIKQQLYWPKMTEDVNMYVETCDKCAPRKFIKTKSHAPLGQVKVGEPF